MGMDHNELHSSATMGALQIQSDVLSSLARHHVGVKRRSAMRLPPLQVALSVYRGVAVCARASPRPPAVFRVPGAGGVPLPDFNVRFVIFE